MVWKTGLIVKFHLLYRILYNIYKEGDHMEAINYSSLRNNLKGYMDKVTDDFETIVVTRKNEKNVVMISAEEYNNLMENMHLLGNEANRKHLIESKKQLEEGLSASQSLLELDWMNIIFTEKAWTEYTDWQKEDKKTLKRINVLIQDIQRNGYEGMGKPEPLRYDLNGYWSRRVNETDRLVYRIDEKNVYILQCKYHYK